MEPCTRSNWNLEMLVFARVYAATLWMEATSLCSEFYLYIIKLTIITLRSTESHARTRAQCCCVHSWSGCICARHEERQKTSRWVLIINIVFYKFIQYFQQLWSPWPDNCFNGAVSRQVNFQQLLRDERTTTASFSFEFQNKTKMSLVKLSAVNTLLLLFIIL